MRQRTLLLRMPDRMPDESSEPTGELAPAPRPVPLRPGENSGSLPPPLKLQPLSRPGAPPTPPPPPPSPSKIELQQLELKGGAAGISIPPRPQRPTAPSPPEDPSGVVPRGWPPPRAALSESGAREAVEESPSESLPRFLPGPEMHRAGQSLPQPPEPPKLSLGPPPPLEEPTRGSVQPDARATWNDQETTPVDSVEPARPVRPRGRSSHGPLLLVGVFGLTFLGVAYWASSKPKPQVSPTAVASAAPTALPSATSSPVASLTPVASVTAVPSPSATAAPSPVAPEPVATTAPEPVSTPSAVVEPSATATPLPPPVETPKPAPTTRPVATPRPALTPKPVVEDPPARPTVKPCIVRVDISPPHIPAKAYVFNSQGKFDDQGEGQLRVQTDKPGSYTLKIMAPGYETFVKEIKVTGEHNLAVRLEKIPPPPEPVYNDPGPAPAPYNPPPPAPYYPPPPPPSQYQIPAPGI